MRVFQKASNIFFPRPNIQQGKEANTITPSQPFKQCICQTVALFQLDGDLALCPALPEYHTFRQNFNMFGVNTFSDKMCLKMDPNMYIL